MFVEMAIGSPSKRGALDPIEDMWDVVYEQGKEQAVYRSVYMYDEDAVKFVRANGSVKNYLGARYIDNIPIDIDKGSNTDEYTLQQAQYILDYLHKEYHLKTGNYAIYFSGTGYHIDISAECIGFKPSENLPYIVKATMVNLMNDIKIDPAVYTRTALIRVAHSLNTKSSLYKIPLSLEELYTNYTNIVKLAQNRRLDHGVEELWGEQSLSDKIVNEVPVTNARYT